MTISRQAAVQEISRYAQRAVEMLGRPGKQWTLALMEKANIDNNARTSRNSTEYLAYEQFGQSAAGALSESTPALPTANDENGVELNWRPALMARTLGLSWERLDAIRAMGGADSRKMGAAKLIGDAFKKERTKMVAQFEGGRGDNVGARAFEAGSGTTFKCAQQVPILFQRGDEVLGYSSDEAGEERLRDAADTSMGSTSVRVVRIVRDAATPSITLSAASTWGVDTVLTWKHAPTISSPLGIPFQLDSVSDGTFKWDSEDGTSSDHMDPNNGADVYFGGTRSANPDLECQIYNAETEELDISLFSTAIGLCIDGNDGDATVVDKLMVGMNIRTWRRFVKNTLGAVRLKNQELFLPGNTTSKMTVPMLDGGGMTPMPVKLSPYLPDGFVIFYHYAKAQRIFTDPGWIPGTDGIWHLLPQASVAGHQAEYQAYMIYKHQTGLFLPNSSCVLWNFDISENV